MGEPYQAVNKKKQKQIIHIANKYIEASERTEEIRFDIISVIINKSAIKIEHIKNAFYPV